MPETLLHATIQQVPGQARPERGQVAGATNLSKFQALGAPKRAATARMISVPATKEPAPKILRRFFFAWRGLLRGQQGRAGRNGIGRQSAFVGWRVPYPAVPTDRSGIVDVAASREPLSFGRSRLSVA
jgi:hypothetical protein